MKESTKKYTDYELFTEIRYGREWLVQSHYGKEDIEEFIGAKLSKVDWGEFIDIADKCFEQVKYDLIHHIIDVYKEKYFDVNDR